MNAQTIADIEQNRREPSLRTTRAIARACGVDACWLAGLEEEKPNAEG